LSFVIRFSDVRADYQRALARSSGTKSIHDHEALHALLVNMQVCHAERSTPLHMNLHIAMPCGTRHLARSR
jgi:hypothetical protein